MPEEFIEEVDWNDNVVKLRLKKDLKQEQFPHRGAVILPLTNNGKIILCKRSKNKWPFPDVLCAAIGGHVKVNESYENAAKREMKEEADLETEIKEIAILKNNTETEQIIHHIFTTQQEIQLNSLKPDPVEIQYLEAFEINEVNKMIQQNPKQFAPTFINVFKAFYTAWQSGKHETIEIK